MSTIASLLALMDPRVTPWSEGQESVNRAERGRQLNQTGLIELEEMKRQQQTNALVRQNIQQNPGLLLNPGGSQSTLASPALTQPPGGGPMTQQTVLPGQPPAAPQPVPGGQDLSQFATQPPGGPQSTLAGLAPQPRQDPLEAIFRTDPDAGLKLLDMRTKRQAQQLEWGLKSIEAVAQMSQGVTDQDSLDQAREYMQQIAPQAAARLPKVYNKDAMEAFQAQALSVKERQTLKIADSQAQSEALKVQLAERQAAAGVPKYTEDSTLNVAIDRRMQQAGIPRGTPPPEAILTQAQKDVEEAKVRVSASQGTGQIVKGPTGEYIRIKPGTDQVEFIKGPGGEPLREKPSETEQKGATLANSVAAANTLATELEEKGYRPSVWDKGMDKLPLGLGNYLTSSDYQKYRQTVREFASAWLYGVSGAQITDSEWENANQTFFPQPNEDKGAVELKRQRRAALVKQLEQQTAATGRTGSQAQPASGEKPSPPPTGTRGQSTHKPVGEMSRDELLAERDRLRKGGG